MTHKELLDALAALPENDNDFFKEMLSFLDGYKKKSGMLIEIRGEDLIVKAINFEQEDAVPTFASLLAAMHAVEKVDVMKILKQSIEEIEQKNANQSTQH